MSRRMLLLLLVALVALAVATAVSFSLASYTTASTTQVTATAASAHGWLHLYSQTTDPAVPALTGYATQRVHTGVAPLCATGSDETLALSMGGIQATGRRGTTYTFTRAFTIQTPATFPVGTVTRVTVTATYIADASTGKQPIRDVRFAAVGSTTGNATVTLNRNVKYQANIRLRPQNTGWVLNKVYTPHVQITVTYTGFTTSYYVYDIPLSVTIVNW